MPGLTVLLVDDARSERMLLRHALTDLHRRLRIVEAATHAEALERFLEDRPDIVFLDIRMPRSNGLDILEDLLLERPETFVVMISHFGTREHVVRALRHGARDFVVKPFSLQKLAEILERVEDERQVRPQRRRGEPPPVDSPAPAQESAR